MIERREDGVGGRSGGELVSEAVSLASQSASLWGILFLSSNSILTATPCRKPKEAELSEETGRGSVELEH